MFPSTTTSKQLNPNNGRIKTHLYNVYMSMASWLSILVPCTSSNVAIGAQCVYIQPSSSPSSSSTGFLFSPDNVNPLNISNCEKEAEAVFGLKVTWTIWRLQFAVRCVALSVSCVKCLLFALLAERFSIYFAFVGFAFFPYFILLSLFFFFSFPNYYKFHRDM